MSFKLTEDDITDARFSMENVVSPEIADAICAAARESLKPTETPGLREGIAYFVSDAWGGYWQTVYEGRPYTFRFSLEASKVEKALRAEIAALSATPQPVAIPDDGAERDEVVGYLVEGGGWMYYFHGPKREHASTIAREAGATVTPLYARTIANELLQLELDAERAAHGQTRREKSFAADILAAETSHYRAEIARLRKALDQCAAIAENQPLFPDTTLGARQEWVKREIAASIRALGRRPIFS